MAEQQSKGYKATAHRLAEMLKKPTVLYSILNSNEDTASLLAADPSAANTKPVLRKDKLKIEYGINDSSFSLTLVRLLAFSEIKKSGDYRFKWYQNPILRNV